MRLSINLSQLRSRTQQLTSCCPILLQRAAFHAADAPSRSPLHRQRHQRAVCRPAAAAAQPPQQTPQAEAPKKRLAVFVSGGGSNFRAIHAVSTQLHGMQPSAHYRRVLAVWPAPACRSYKRTSCMQVHPPVTLSTYLDFICQVLLITLTALPAARLLGRPSWRAM